MLTIAGCSLWILARKWALRSAGVSARRPWKPAYDRRMQFVDLGAEMGAALGRGLGQAAVEALDVAAGHEVVAGAAHHHAAHRRVRLDPGHDLDQGTNHIVAQGVEGLGPVEGHGGDAVGHLQEHGFGHGGFISL
jgi:hypothetical protein